MSSCAELVAEFAGFGLLKQLCYGAGGKQRTCFSPDEWETNTHTQTGTYPELWWTTALYLHMMKVQWV